MRTETELLADLAEVVRHSFSDRDFPDTVDASTRVLSDLGLASIEIVVLAERLEAHFGRRLAFGNFLKELRATGAEDIELGQLVAFLQQQLG